MLQKNTFLAGKRSQHLFLFFLFLFSGFLGLLLQKHLLNCHLLKITPMRLQTGIATPVDRPTTWVRHRRWPWNSKAGINKKEIHKTAGPPESGHCRNGKF
jgi:hypothetical protein